MAGNVILITFVGLDAGAVKALEADRTLARWNKLSTTASWRRELEAVAVAVAAEMRELALEINEGASVIDEAVDETLVVNVVVTVAVMRGIRIIFLSSASVRSVAVH